MIYYSLGTALVSETELRSVVSDPKYLQWVKKSLRKRSTIEPFPLSNGVVRVEDLSSEVTFNDETRPFTPVGFGQPLLIRIQEVYTGKFPSGRWGRPSRLLIATAVRDTMQLDPQVLGLNLLIENPDPKTRYTVPNATSPGTLLVYYSPAELAQQLSLQVVMNFRNFNSEMLETLGDIIGSVGTGLGIASFAVPAFVLAAPIAIAGGRALRTGSKLAQRLLENGPEVDVSVPLNLKLAGQRKLRSGFALIVDPTHLRLDESFLRNHCISKDGSVVRQDNLVEPYDGDVPYVVVSFDGISEPSFESFRPAHISAKLMQEFFGGEHTGTLNADVIEVFKVFSDFKHRQLLDQITQDLEVSTGATREQLLKRQIAIQKHIFTKELLPKITKVKTVKKILPVPSARSSTRKRVKPGLQKVAASSKKVKTAKSSNRSK